MTYKDYCKRYGWIPPIAKLLKRALYCPPRWRKKLRTPLGKVSGSTHGFVITMSCSSVNLYEFLGIFFYYLGRSRIHQTLQKNKLLTWLEQLAIFK